MLAVMSAIKAHVVKGMIVLDEPVELPEGAAAEVFLLVDDEPSPAERTELERAIDEGAEDFARGDFVDAREFALRLAAKP